MGLTAEQRHKFLAWSERNADRIKAKFEKKQQEMTKPKEGENYQLLTTIVVVGIAEIDHPLPKKSLKKSMD
jgi:hypothetical protein